MSDRPCTKCGRTEADGATFGLYRKRRNGQVYGPYRLSRCYKCLRRPDRNRGKKDSGSERRRKKKLFFDLVLEAPWCVACGSFEQLTLDRIVPKARGGKIERDNVQILCMPCNSSKGDRELDLRRHLSSPGATPFRTGQLTHIEERNHVEGIQSGEHPDGLEGGRTLTVRLGVARRLVQGEPDRARSERSERDGVWAHLACACGAGESAPANRGGRAARGGQDGPDDSEASEASEAEHPAAPRAGAGEAREAVRRPDKG